VSIESSALRSFQEIVLPPYPGRNIRLLVNKNEVKDFIPGKSYSIIFTKDFGSNFYRITKYECSRNCESSDR
jgi:hypothetical protein